MSALICYIDILGFSNHVLGQSDSQLIDTIDVLDRISQFFKDVKKLQIEKDTKEGKLNAELMDLIRIEIFNDSILVIGDFHSGGSIAEREWGKDPAIIHFMEIFIFGCSFICVQIINEFKLMCRGSMVVGNYRRVSKEGLNIILSKAIIEAVKLEKEARFPRIIIGESIIEYCESIGSLGRELITKHFFKDEDNKFCLDIWKDVVSNATNAEVSQKSFEAYEEILKCEPMNEFSKYEWFKRYVQKRKSK